jgi:hypothetical protein
VSDDWKRYPWVPEWGDAGRFTFPRCDGTRGDLGMATYFMDGFLHGRTSGREYAFIVIVTDMRVLWRRVRVGFHTFALFDCERGRYGTYTDFDLPRPPRRRPAPKLHTAPDHLALRWDGAAGSSTWLNRRDAAGALVPFAWTLDLHGTDHDGAAMGLELEVEAERPPAPLGGPHLRGQMMFLGAESTSSYFQSGLRMSGRLSWGAETDEVEGTVGWIDRQWAVRDFMAHQDLRARRYRSEWRVMQLDNGWDLSVFHQYQRDAGNVLVPWTGASAQGPGPDFELRATPRVELIVPELVRDPKRVAPRMALGRGPQWFPRRYRMRIPEWEMDVAAEPLVETPAHRLPIEYWTGPVRIAGTFLGESVTGLGFDERSRPWARPSELAAAVRLTAEHLDGVDDDAAWLLAYRAWEVEALALRRSRAAARRHAQTLVAPLAEALPPDARDRVMPLVEDLLKSLGAPR